MVAIKSPFRLICRGTFMECALCGDRTPDNRLVRTLQESDPEMGIRRKWVGCVSRCRPCRAATKGRWKYAV